MRTLFRVGLTGGVGSGKSTIAALLAQRGAGIVDADMVAHRLTQPAGAAIEQLRQEFGLNAIAADGSLDRGAMRQRTFADPQVRRRLEALLHPLIRDEMAVEERALAAKGTPYAVFVIPLLIETGHAHERVDRVLLVDCSVQTQLERVTQRPGIDHELALRIVDAQATRGQRLAAADDVLFNEAPMPDIEQAIDRLHATYLRLAKDGATSCVGGSREAL